MPDKEGMSEDLQSRLEYHQSTVEQTVYKWGLFGCSFLKRVSCMTQMPNKGLKKNAYQETS